MNVKKPLAIAIILLFFSVSVIPSTGTTVEKKSTMPTFYDGNTLYVGGDGPGNYTKIQDAIDNASDGDTVFVYNDSSPYYENVKVKKSICLIGEDRETTVIDGGGSGNVIRINAQWVNISEFTIMNSKYAYDFAGVRILSDYTHITDCIVSDSYFGIFVKSQSNVTIIGNVISNSFIGVLPYYSSNVIISNNTMMYNYYGIDFHFSNYTIASGNKIFYNCRGIYSTLSNNNIILNNNISSSIHNIIFWESKNHNVSGNILSDGSEKSIAILENSRNNIISGNIISNSFRGIIIYSSSNNTIYHNNFINNSYQASDNGNNTWDNDGFAHYLGESTSDMHFCTIIIFDFYMQFKEFSN